MNQDETLQEIREARIQIWHECGEDWSNLLSFYQALDKENQSLVIKKPKPAQENSLANVMVA